MSDSRNLADKLQSVYTNKGAKAAADSLTVEAMDTILAAMFFLQGDGNGHIVDAISNAVRNREKAGFR